MKVKTVLVLVCVTGVLVAITSSRGERSRPTTPAPRAYASCAALNAVYPGGVARGASSRNAGDRTRVDPTVSARVYALNRKLDPDRDGIACER